MYNLEHSLLHQLEQSIGKTNKLIHFDPFHTKIIIGNHPIFCIDAFIPSYEEKSLPYFHAIIISILLRPFERAYSISYHQRDIVLPYTSN